MRPWLSIFAWLALVAVPAASGQTSATTPPPKPIPRKSYCQPDDGFCFQYPASWAMLGDVYDGNGVVIAPAQKQHRSLWDEITVAMIVPPAAGDEGPASLDSVIESATAGLREGGQAFETLQRQRRIVDGKPAQLLKVRYHEKSNNGEWVEEIVFIQGPDNEIYSVALKCSPVNLARREPSFNAVLKSWRLPQSEPDNAESAPPANAAPAPSH